MPRLHRFLVITPATLPNAITQESYSETLSVTGGSGPFSFSSAGMPAGLHLSTAGVIAGTATMPGIYQFTVTVTDPGGDIRSQIYTLQVNPAPSILSVSPAQAARNQRLDVTITGQSTNFLLGPLTADFGPGVYENSVTAVTATSAVVNISIGLIATTTVRDVTLTGGAGIVTKAAAFTVLHGSGSLAAMQPNTGRRGQTLLVHISGSDTHFQQDLTRADFGEGITVISVTVVDNTHITVNISIDASAALDPRRTVTVITAGGAPGYFGYGFIVTA